MIRKKLKVIRQFLFLFTLLMVMYQAKPALQANAMSKANKKAHAAFQKQLKKDKSSYICMGKLKYTYKDVDGDKVDELIIYPGFGSCTQMIYDYQKGKVKSVCAASQGTFTRYYKKRKVITVLNSGHMGALFDYYYKWKNGTYEIDAYARKEYGTYDYSSTPKTVTYYVKGKKVSKSVYKAYVKKLTKGSGVKFSKIKWKEY